MASTITLDDAAEYLGASDDDLPELQRVVDAAEAAIAKRVSLPFTDATITDVIDGGVDELVLSIAPISAVAQVVDRTDNTVLDPELYDVDPDRGFVIKEHGFFARGRRRWAVDYTAGYTAGQVPDDLQQAVLLLAQTWWSNRGSGGGQTVSEKIGDYSYTLSEGSLGESTFRQVLDLIQPYTEPAV